VKPFYLSNRSTFKFNLYRYIKVGAAHGPAKLAAAAGAEGDENAAPDASVAQPLPVA
jgi:hypothetical protein